VKFDYAEGATPIDKTEALGLKLSHITTMAELNRWEHDNILEAYEWLKVSKPTGILTDTFIKLLHKKMFGDVWQWAGNYRKTEKNIGSEWWSISTAVVELCSDVKYWVQNGKEKPDMMAAMFHCRLLQIHPFPNGNGRYARLITDIFLEVILSEEKFTWGGGQSIAEPGEIRRQYIQALHKADGSDYVSLLEFARS
jgi:Fic-DOC domain mobile mystery protein B